MNKAGSGDLKAHLSRASTGLCMIYDCPTVDAQLSPSEAIPYNLVDFSGLTPRGVRITHNRTIEKGTPIGFMAYDNSAIAWESYRAVVESSAALPEHPDSFTCDLKFVWQDATYPGDSASQARVAGDLDFLMGTTIFESIPPHAPLHLINCLRRRSYKAGEFLYTRTETGKSLFIIQKGICTIRAHKDNQTHPVSRLKHGEVCGELAVLTGEERNSYGIAETEMTVWEFGRKLLIRWHQNTRICAFCSRNSSPNALGPGAMQSIARWASTRSGTLSDPAAGGSFTTAAIAP